MTEAAFHALVRAIDNAAEAQLEIATKYPRGFAELEKVAAAGRLLGETLDSVVLINRERLTGGGA